MPGHEEKGSCADVVVDCGEGGVTRACFGPPETRSRCNGVVVR